LNGTQNVGRAQQVLERDGNDKAVNQHDSLERSSRQSEQKRATPVSEMQI
jgi:hypothetical protein